MIPFPVRLIVTLLGAGLMLGSFAIRSSVDRGLEIRRDAPPPLGTDAAAFTMRVIGAVVLMAGLLTWVVNSANRTHTGIF
ncbi:MAG: hypothetical protein NVSMB19_07550 [Vulcanimicrobiaceae bacterium]